MAGTEAVGDPFRCIVQLLVLTGQRKSEVTGMRWTELDLANRIWRIPADRTKPGRAHEVPLTNTVIELLRCVPKLHDEFVFPARGRDNPASGFSKWKRELDALAGINAWRLHDLRRTVASGMARRKVPPHVIERVLNHVTVILGGVAGIYNRFGYLDEMREALELWSNHIAESVAIKS